MVRKKSLPTLRDVSKLARVGTTTVSRAINGGERVKPATLARVQKAIKKLGFQPNQAARILKGESTKSLGIVVPSIADPFFSCLAAAAEQVARAKGYIVIVVSSGGDTAIEQSEIEALTRHRIDGLLIAPSYPQSANLLAALRGLGKPVVAIDRPFANGKSAQVVTDNRKSARMAVEHLIDHGHTRIACIGAESVLPTIKLRVQGYRDAMRKKGLAISISSDVINETSAQHVMAELMSSAASPTALFTTKNLTTMMVFAVLQNMGYAIPKDVAIIGFDDFDMSRWVSPPVSVVRQPVEEMGKQAATLLLETIEKPSADKHRRIVLDSELKLRASCGCA
jgi:LacI family transcriptional regulator